MSALIFNSHSALAPRLAVFREWPKPSIWTEWGTPSDTNQAHVSALGQKQTFALQKRMSALPPIADMRDAKRDVRFVPIADIEGLGMRRFTLLELSSMELHEVAHIRRCFAGELAHGGRHAVVTPLLGQLGHG
jgi:hypothetical protein